MILKKNDLLNELSRSYIMLGEAEAREKKLMDEMKSREDRDSECRVDIAEVYKERARSDEAQQRLTHLEEKMAHTEECVESLSLQLRTASAEAAVLRADRDIEQQVRPTSLYTCTVLIYVYCPYIRVLSLYPI